MDNLDTSKLEIPTIIHAKRFVDDRGSLMFMNDLNLSQFKRFYLIQNHRTGFIRAWHGHLKESKLLIPIVGTFLVGAAKIDDKGLPAENSAGLSFVLNGGNPSGLFVPAGYANGSKSLTSNAQLLVLSTTTLAESKDDDYRLPFDQWNIWNEDFR